MPLIEYAQFGIGFFTIAIFAILTEKFLKSMEAREKRFLEYMERQEKDFKSVIENHLHTHTESNYKLTETIKELLDWLKYYNGKK